MSVVVEKAVGLLVNKTKIKKHVKLRPRRAIDATIDKAKGVIEGQTETRTGKGKRIVENLGT